MRTLRNISTASMRIAPQWVMCVILGAYFSAQLVNPGVIAG
ncbi:MAG TPA: hypothetical protein PK050_03645 [Hyphomonadaceae bacterium]|jgi:hypothetical protein|nr:hypothetical protein [Hyphomonadaceae bacterium]